ncbi:hypothetical protein Pisl_1360 [Pyrobaculum islandicum DSM 4184]|uniref:Uncharacterized protein n=1 Tax=Pyrobaculum islandicum (strain DSM 4184 / JCM 9189 / GEO3) TaxID=384616 RepID=A1RU90_PYRIL|nr:hypothetical protein [Pyrobaculum islandicum]ABL88522.1 hypothetical protein Pisl_1360 [Pyrobaculum islandicum DSM 4184]
MSWGIFVDAARIYIVVTDRACGEKIMRAVEDLTRQYGAELIFLKGKYIQTADRMDGGADREATRWRATGETETDVWKDSCHRGWSRPSN